MELLFSKNPAVTRLGLSCVNDYFIDFVETASEFNIATGFITNESIAELKRIVEYRQNSLTINMFIGMNYLSGFTKLQYNAVNNLNALLSTNGIGEIYLSDKALFHGKMYSFVRGNDCVGAFVGSSNLGSFVGTSQNHIESDIFFNSQEASGVNQKIINIIKHLGTKITILPEPEFINPDIKLLRDYKFVTELAQSEVEILKSKRTGVRVEIPLKTEKKSNLNTYFGAGKIKGKYSPRGWYEVEIIINKNLPNEDALPKEEPFTVVTTDGFQFQCERQGDYKKNLRSSKDLKILGRWIKGQMENDGALDIGNLVTKETLQIFGKTKLVFEKTTLDSWLLTIE